MSCEPFGQNQIDTEKVQWTDSMYRFTEPVRYYKSNDPYYWEVDNIPIKQLEENVLWLKEQLGTVGSVEISGITREDFLDLKPEANGSSRTVKVLPGKFLARINDAYNKGIGSVTKVNPGELGPLDFRKKQYQFNITTSILKKLVGNLLGSPLYSNGLYDHIQHHEVASYSGNAIIDWTNISHSLLNVKSGIANIPKNKLALWRQSSTSKNSPNSPNASDLQQMSVDLTRAWGGTARTALVNVQEALEIEIPSFSQTDYMNHTPYTPRIRFDLLFIYSHPSDAASTTIAAANGDNPTSITTPQLGIVKGAGVVKVRGTGLFSSYDSRDPDSDTFFSDPLYQDNINNTASYFTSEDGLDDEKNYQIISPISDNNQTDVGAGGVFGNLPSPDDLMNLAPLIQEGLSDSFSLIGQTVLPVAYVIVREGVPAITSSDIIDIRPFFRTAELAYNERSGLAAANPPLSFANPAVGKFELEDSIQKASNYMSERIFNLEVQVGVLGGDQGGGDSSPLNNAFITKGVILGGTQFGVEGALLHLETAYGGGDSTGNVINSEQQSVAMLKKRHLPGLESMPYLPGWDIADWCVGLPEQGLKRNDRINSSVRLGSQFFRIPATTNTFLDQVTKPVLDNNLHQSVRTATTSTNSAGDTTTSFGPGYADYDLVYFLKKKMTVQLPTAIKDYDVRCNFVNCIPATGSAVSPGDHQSSPRSTNNYGGIFVEKHASIGTTAKFTIFVPFSPGIQNMLNEGYTLAGLYRATGELDHTNRAPYQAHNALPMSAEDTDDIDEKRDSQAWSAFRVISNLGILGLQGNNWNYQRNWWAGGGTYEDINPKTLPPMMVTYPTVEFSIVGHVNTFQNNYISDTIVNEVNPV